MRQIAYRTAGVAFAAACAALLGASAGAARAEGLDNSVMGGFRGPFVSSRIIYGDREVRLRGGGAYTWARVNPQGSVLEAGVSIPRELIQYPPAYGTGPAGSFLVLNFPDAVKATTFLDHFEMHWEPQGHPPEVFLKPHFDFHFYGIPESSVFNIMPPDTVAPAPNMLPAGYFYPGVDQAVPQMGVHAIDPRDLSRPFTASMILGYWGGHMTFIEPMITQEYLLGHPDLAMPIPRPQYLYRATDYPSVVQVHYNPRTRSYEFTFRGFSPIQAPPLAD